MGQGTRYGVCISAKIGATRSDTKLRQPWDDIKTRALNTPASVIENQRLQFLRACVRACFFHMFFAAKRHGNWQNYTTSLLIPCSPYFIPLTNPHPVPTDPSSSFPSSDFSSLLSSSQLLVSFVPILPRH